MGFFAFIFVFLLGGVVSLAAAAFAIHYILLVAERKTDAQRQKLAKEVSPEESQRAVQLLIPELKTKVRFSFSAAPWPKEAAKRMMHTTIVLKANMFFHFVDEKRDACNIARLDNCAVEVLRQDGKPKFNKKNYLKIVSPAGSLFPDAASSGGTTSKNAGDTCYIKFFNGKDLEQWFYALKSATSLTITKEVKEVELLQAQQRYFAHLTAVANNSSEVNADWTNALLGRIFWGIHNHPVFLKLITEKLQKKMAKLKKPKFVESISVTDVGFGPNLPLFSNIKIISVSPQGSLAFDGDVYYHGGFNLMIDINLRIDLPIGGVSVEVPIRASVVVKAFAGRGHIQVAPPPAKRAWIGFYGEPRVDMDIKIEVGKNLSLVNIPSIANIVINKIKQQLIKKLVLPAMDDWPLPHIPSTKTTTEVLNAEKDAAHPGALLSSSAEAGITASSLNQSSSASSPILSRTSTQPERTTSFSGASSSSPLSSSSSSIATKRHSVAAIPAQGNTKASQPITVRTRTSPRDRGTVKDSTSNPPPLPSRTRSAPAQASNQPQSPLVETGSGAYKPLTTYPAGGPPPAKEGASTIAGLQLPSSPPRGQWNSTDEWYQNSLMALRDRDDSDDDSDRESDKRASEERERTERERKEKEQREAEEKEKKLKEGREREEREKQEREAKEKKEKEEQERREREEREKQEMEAKEEKERLERVRAKEEKDRREKEREEREKREREEEGKTEADSPLTEEKPTRSSEDMREIEQFTPIEKREEHNDDVDEENRRRELEDKERKEREESERKEKEKKEQEKDREEKLAEQERKEREEKERHERERTGMVAKHEVFTDPLSSSLNSPIIDEIFGSGSSSGEDSPPPRRQATFDGNMPTPALPDAPHRRRSGSLNFAATATTTGSPAKPPALPPRAHETAPASSQPKPAQQPATKYRTTSHMFEDFDFSFPSTTPAATGSPLAPTSAPHPSVPTPPTSSFLGLTTPAVPMTSSPPSPRRALPPSSASNTDNLFSFSASTSSAASSSSAPSTKPGAKKGLFNLDMDDLFNKVEKQHHLVEKFKAAKTRAQNAINDWNHTNPDQDL